MSKNKLLFLRISSFIWAFFVLYIVHYFIKKYISVSIAKPLPVFASLTLVLDILVAGILLKCSFASLTLNTKIKHAIVVFFSIRVISKLFIVLDYLYLSVSFAITPVPLR